MALRIRFQYPTGSTLGYSIERLADGLLFDFSTASFVVTPATLINPLLEDSGSFKGRYKVTFGPTPQAVFTDGDYVITVHDLANSDAVVAELGCTMYAGDDATELLDPQPTTPPGVPVVGDPGFETVSVGTNTYGSFAYNPTGSAWTFGPLSGLAGNGSGFTSGNPNAPQGTQVAFLQMTGSISQTIANWEAGTYSLSFSAAQRVGPNSLDFQVLIDNAVVGTFKPTSTSYQTYTTPGFTVAAGPHTVQFLGLNTAGGDNSVLLDNVTIAHL